MNPRIRAGLKNRQTGGALLAAVLIVVLAACGAPTPRSAAVSPTAAPLPAEETLIPFRTDVSLIANTGRPQFLNSFAAW